jgi:hypothetical protein
MRSATIALLGAVALAAVIASSQATARSAGAAGCRPPEVSASYASRVERVLGSGRDVWGLNLLRARNGPTLAAARRVLPPLLYAVGHRGRPLTASGVYYLPLTIPWSVGGSRSFGLHVADGSEILIRRTKGPRLFVHVGPGGRERYGSCLTRLETPRLAQGYLPMLQVAYTDATGVRYHEESFVGRDPHTGFVSYLRITADAARATRDTVIRLGTSRGGSLRVAVPQGESAELDAAFVHNGARLEGIDPYDYDEARTVVVNFWERALESRPTFDVPEADVLDAERALVIQELEMTWRYSVGNPYEELSYPEALDVAQVMAAYGQADAARQILRFTLRRLPGDFTSWRAGERLLAGARYFQLQHDRAYLAEETPGLARVVARLGRELARSRNGLLPRERYSADIAREVYSLQGQTLVWQGLLAMAGVWKETGRGSLAGRARSLALRLEHGLRRAVAHSERRLKDGSLFVPAGLLEKQAPFHRLTHTREGSYWNLVAPYALASGFFAPHSRQARGLLRYLLHHGSRLLGLVRAGAYRLRPADAGDTFSGTDQVYGQNVARFLADNDQPDQLVLSLYGTLGAALAPGTYVAGEAASVTPLRGSRFRSMYLPPNSNDAAVFLETLRLLLVHEVRDREAQPTGLELAFSTPRGWLAKGKTITVQDAPTSFGTLSYTIERRGNRVLADLTVPGSRLLRSLRLRLRLPSGEEVATVEAAGRAVPFDSRSGTIDLTGLRGVVRVVATVRSF